MIVKKIKHHIFHLLKYVVNDFYEKDNIIEDIKSFFSPKPKKNKNKEMNDINKNKFLENEIYLKCKKLGYLVSDVTTLRSVGEWNIGKKRTIFIECI